MRTLYLLLLLLAAMLAAVTVLNWEAFVSPTELSLGFASVSLPLGLTLLSLLVLLTVIFLVHAVYLQGTVLLDTRRHSKELQVNRELADKAEASRFTALQEFISTELTRQRCGRPRRIRRCWPASRSWSRRRRPSPSRPATRWRPAWASWKTAWNAVCPGRAAERVSLAGERTARP